MQKKSSNATNKIASIIILAIIIGAGGFVGGMQYQKGHSTTTTATTVNRGQFGQGGGFGHRNGTFGTVTAISPTSITVQGERANSTKTYIIDSGTAITDDGAIKAASNITVGENVIVGASSSTSTTATSIMINTGMGNAPGGQQMPSSQTN